MARGKDAPLNNFKSLTDMHTHPQTIQIFECRILFPWRCGGGWQEWKAHAKSRRVWVFTVYTKTHKSMSKCVGVRVWGRAGMGRWIGMGSCDLQAVCFCLDGGIKTAYQMVHSAEGLNLFLLISLHRSHISTCRERSRQLFVCIFCLESSPAAHIYFSWQSSLNSYSRVMFLQLFRHRHFVAMSLYQACRCINTQTGSTQHALEAKYQHHSSS